MSTIREDQRRLDNIARMYHKTGGDLREMWRKKWYELIKQIGGRIDESKTTRLTADSGQIH